MLLHTEVFGKGDPLVFLHSGLHTGLTDFEYQRGHFKKNFRVLCPDLRGHGKSRENDLSNYFEDCASDLAETLEHYNLERVHLVGCSLGALAGLKFAKMFPAKVISLTVSGIFTKKPVNWAEMNNAQVEEQKEFLLKDEKTAAYFDNLHTTD
ncbi:alpha/beta fold hydrolase [Bacillus salacetis]|uniref:alpha/beta fold hydrolase n=1 Tax=Bacillus salacetis TaxID=2315464 RepID=UPI001F0BC3C2|nr:alpha/beta hydrolase [Bacillus salacetis]